MTCQTPHPDLFRFLDERLSTDERERFEAHLESCPVCMQAKEEWMQQREALRHFPQPEVPVSMSAQIVAQIEAYEAQKPSGWLEQMLPMLRWATPAFAGAAVCVWVLQLWVTPPQPGTQLASASGSEMGLLLGHEDKTPSSDASESFLLGD